MADDVVIRRSPPPRPPPPNTTRRSATFSDQMRLNDLLRDEMQDEDLVLETKKHSPLLKSHSDATEPSSDASDRAAAGMEGIRKVMNKAKQKKKDVKEKLTKRIKRRSKSTSSNDKTTPEDSECETAVEALSAESVASAEVPAPIEQPTDEVTVEPQAVRMRANQISASPPRANEMPAPSQESLSQVASHSRGLIMGRNRIIFGSILVAATVVWPGFVIGFLWGIYLCVLVFFWLFVSEANEIKHETELDFMEQVTQEQIDREGELVFKGWMNELRGSYDPSSYHVNNTRPVLVRLHGSVLRLAHTNKRSVRKHTCVDDPLLSQATPTVKDQRIYDLTASKVRIRPRRLAKRRWWSKKYPICILLPIDSQIISKNTDTTNTDTESGSDGGEMGLKDDISISSLHSVSGSEIAISEKDTKITRKRRKILYLFARCSREKERWFHRLRQATCQARMRPSRHSEGNISTSTSEPNLDKPKCATSEEGLLYLSAQKQFERYMSDVISNDLRRSSTGEDAGGTVYMDLGRKSWIHNCSPVSLGSESVATANAMGARIFYDFCRDAHWIGTLQEKIQGKLSTIRLPYFIETLSLSKLDPGHIPPKVTAVYEPNTDEWGLWMDLEMQYMGGIRLELETKVNLMKLKAEAADDALTHQDLTQRRPTTRYSDEDLPESPESSPDDDVPSFLKQDGSGTPKESAKKRILNLVDKIAQSKYFQQATEIKSVKRVMQGISSTRLMLLVEVTYLEGTMAVNVPPPPSDRLWYGFRRRPRVTLRAIPRVGDRSVDLSSISDWIETRLRVLIEKNLVVPNLDDLIVPFMSGNPMLSMGYNK